jgi:hypothetical protein
MAARGSTLGRKQEDAIAALLTQRNVEDAARAAGIGTRTLLRWLKLPEFQTAYREARRAAFGQAVARLQQGASAAATTLLKTMIDTHTPASVRIRAAEAIFNHAAKAIEIEDIEARVSELERVAATQAEGPLVDSSYARAQRRGCFREAPSDHALHHDDEEDFAFIPSAEPAHPPAIDTITQCSRLSETEELGLDFQFFQLARRCRRGWFGW